MQKTFTQKPSTLIRNQLPNRVQGEPLGSPALPNTVNTSGQLTGIKTLGQSPPTVLQPGAVQAEEQFSHRNIPVEISRALNQVQRNVNSAMQQVKADPTANKNLHENVVLSHGTVVNGVPGKPNVINHGLNMPYRGYRICTVKGGYLTGHSALPSTTTHPASANLLLWTQFKPFQVNGVDNTVTADIEVYS